MSLVAFLLLLTAGLGARAQTPWAVKDAKVRAVVTLKEAPKFPDAGAEISVPDFGLVKPAGGDYTLLDAGGKPVPIAAVWQAEAQDTLLLARDLQAGQSYYLYIGGAKGAAWTPKTSLLMEMRHSRGTRGETYNSGGALQAAWNGAAGQTQGARFVNQIYIADNPFGEQTFFLSHFSGYLAPTSTDTEIFTNSTDSSFIFVNDQPFIDWTGRPSGNAADKSVHSRKFPASAAPVKIDYYQAKGGGEEVPNMSMGMRNAAGHVELVPESAFLHAGETEVEKFESQQGAPVPAPIITFQSYLGFSDTYLFEAHCKLAPTDLQDATVEWRFEDGAVFTGREVKRILSGVPGVQRVTVTARRGADALTASKKMSFYGKPPPEAAGGKTEGTKGKSGHERYVDLLMELDASKLTAPMLAAALPLLFDSGTDAQTAVFTNAWLALKPDLRDPLWLPAYSARIRTLAQTDPKSAVAEIAGNAPARQYYNQQLNLLELEVLVFSVHDMSVLPRVQQLAFGLGAEAGKLGDIRVGDLYRLNGNTEQAIARYRAAQPPDPSNGRKLPAEDQANSLTIEDLLSNGTRQEAADALRTWELAHPMAKFTTNFLVLRARVLALYGRWREAVTEMEAFPAAHPDSPYAIDVDFYRARALYELGTKDEARKIWRSIAKEYPRSELAKPSLDWANKS